MRSTKSISRVLASLAVAFATVVLAAPSPTATADPNLTLLTWNQLTPANPPPARQHAAMAFDPATGTTVLFGGRAASVVLADTWTWDGSTWTAQSPAASPPPLESASMAYDNISRRVLLFGGIGSDGNATSGTWAWNGATWSQLTSTAIPPARYAASMAADAATGHDVLFGGVSATGSSLSDTWVWDGTNWTARLPAASPSARSGAAMTFDATRGVLVLFGGTTGSDNSADTWTWNGSTWSQQNPVSSPPARNDAALAFDAATQSDVLFGGSGGGGSALGDTWLWNGSTWATSLPLSLIPILSPPARMGASVAPSPGSQRVMLFGGQPGSGGALGDTWTVATVAVAPPPTVAPTTVAPTATTQGAVTTTSTTAAPKPSTNTPSPQPSAVAPAAGGHLDVMTPSVPAGGQVTVSGSGFMPGAPVVVTLDGAKGVSIHADAQGRFTASVPVPAGASSGSAHTITADGAAPTGRPAVLVAHVTIAGPGRHHSWLLPAAMVALTLAVAVGAGVVLTESTRRHLHATR